MQGRGGAGRSKEALGRQAGVGRQQGTGVREAAANRRATSMVGHMSTIQQNTRSVNKKAGVLSIVRWELQWGQFRGRAAMPIWLSA